MTGDKSVAASHRVIYLCYYLLLSVFFAAAFFPNYRIWGVNWWGYFPSFVPIVLLAVGALVPIVLRFIIRNDSSPIETAQTDTDRHFLLISIVILFFTGLLFYVFRTSTHFLGDGYQNIARLATNPLVKYREFGESLIHLWVKQLVGGDPQAAAIASYRAVSITSGILFVAVTALGARRLFNSLADRLLFMLGLLSGGYILLFFGYAEHYSMFALSVGIFTLIGVLIATGKVSRWWAVPLLVLPIFFHVLGATVIPAGLYLLLAGTRAGNWLRFVNRYLKWSLIVALLAVSGFAFYHFYENSLYFRFAFVPPFTTMFTLEGYTLFSLSHLADCFNLLLLLVPSLPIVGVAIFGGGARKLLAGREVRFLGILIAGAMGAAFIFDPKIGMPRDWDLFSFLGLPLATLVFYLIVQRAEEDRSMRRVAICGIATGLLLLGPRVAALNMDEIAIAHFKNYTQLDHTKSRNAHALLIDYYAARGEQEKSDSAKLVYDTGYPERILVQQAEKIRADGFQHFPEAVTLLYRSLAVNPTYADAWWQMGECYTAMGMYDSALTALRISDGLNPNNPNTLNNLAVALLYLNRTDEAEKILLQAYEIDSTGKATLANLAGLYATKRDYMASGYYLERRTVLHGGTAEEYIRVAGYYYRIGEYRMAAGATEQALGLGLDSALYESALRDGPKMIPYLKSSR